MLLMCFSTFLLTTMTDTVVSTLHSDYAVIYLLSVFSWKVRTKRKRQLYFWMIFYKQLPLNLGHNPYSDHMNCSVIMCCCGVLKTFTVVTQISTGNLELWLAKNYTSLHIHSYVGQCGMMQNYSWPIYSTQECSHDVCFKTFIIAFHVCTLS